MADERSVGELLDELFGFEPVAKRQTALEQYDRGELARKARSRELLGVLRGVEASEHAARESAVQAVDGYVRRVESAALARARKLASVVGPLQMERRYAAFLRMEDKAELLTCLEQTLSFIEVKLRANTADRVHAAYDAAGALVLRDAARLSDVRVAGSTVEPVSLPESVCVACETACDAGELSELLAQVKKSFATYRRVVADGGLFCAFGSDSPHGICRGSNYLDYDSRLDEDVLVGGYNGATRHDVCREVPIPELVDEASAEGGDSLKAAVARMQEFNGRRYDGVLDEDPARHVNAFWYGLKKLSQYCEAAVRVDERAWDCFVDKVQFAYDEPVGRLATQMDDKQVAAFVAAVEVLGADE